MLISSRESELCVVITSRAHVSSISHGQHHNKEYNNLSTPIGGNQQGEHV